MLRFVPRIAAVLLLVMAGTLAPAAEDRPFHASGVGPVSYGSLFAWDVEATHLGRSLLLVNSDPFTLEYSGIFTPYRGTLISASGDELYFEFDAEYYVPDPVTGVVNATVTFTGGTGRFQDATSSADMMIDFDEGFQSFLFLIDGSINY